jgi:uncharacterized membrane protein YgcG
MTRRMVLVVATAAALAAPASATAGGLATVGLDSLPVGLEPGEPWTVELTILQHGRTPLQGVKPSVTVEKAGAGEQETFPARETDEPGVYRAKVVFASAGTWTYTVDDGFAAKHDYAPVKIGAGCEDEATSGGGGAAAGGGTAAGGDSSGGGEAGASGGPDYLLAFLVAGVAGLAAALGAAALQRRREGPASASG